MKKIFSLISISVVAALGMLSCVNGAKEITEVDYTRVLTPTDIKAEVNSTGDHVVFSWAKSKGATDFEVELYSDDALSSMVERFSVSAEKIPYTHKLVADETYYFRVRGIDAYNILEPSKWAVFEDSKTGEPKAIKTYAIKSSVSPYVVSRDVTSIEIAWELPEGDTEISHVAVANAGGVEVDYPVTDPSEGVVIQGLEPSSFYMLTVHFKSANRGSVIAWTRPANDGTPVQVQDTVALKQAVKDGAQYIKVLRNDADTTYVVGEMKLTAPLKIVGDADAQGNKPAIAGRFTVGAGCTSFRAEDIAFSGYAVAAKGEEGGMSQQTHLFTVNDVATFENVEFVNINVEGYQRGLYYDNKGGSVNGTLLFDGVRVDDITGSGGDNIDIRQTCNIASVILRNSTFNGGTRTFLRVDAKPALGQLIVEQCTFNNMCYNGSDLVIGGSNVQGLLAVKSKPSGTFAVRKNVFLNNQCWLVGSNTACFVPAFEKNYVYASAEQFFTSAKLDGTGARSDMSKAVVLAEGGVELTEDPCTDSMGGKFNLTNNNVIKAGVGDPRWFQPYVHVPEDLTQDVTAAVHTWDFGNSKLFYKQAEEDMVRDGIRFYVGGGDPIVFGGSVSFAGAAVVGTDGVPTKNAMSVKVSQAGSLVLSTECENGCPCSFVLTLDGKPVGAVASGETRKQVVVSGVEAGVESMLYICPTGPGAVTEMQWNAETSYVSQAQLETPQISLSTAQATQGDEITLTISEVKGAASYSVRIDGGNAGSTKELEYVIKTASLAAGAHTVSVIAVPAGDDMLRVVSESAQANFELKEKPVPTPGGTAGKITFDSYVGAVPATVSDGSLTLNINNAGAKMAIDENSCYFGTAEKPVKYTSRLKTGGKSGSTNGLTVQIEDGAAGKLYIVVRTGSNSATDRNVVVTKAGSEVFNHVVLESEKTSGVVIEGETDPKDVYPVYEIDVTAGDYVITYPVSSVNFYGFEFVPAGAPGPAPVSKSWVFASEDWQTEFAKMGESGKDISGTWNITIDGLNYSASKSRWTNKCIQVTQDGRADGNGVFTFTAPAAGIVTVSASGTGSTPSGDRNVVITTDGASEQVSTNCNVPSNGDPATATFTVAAGEQKIYVSGALRIYSVSYDPAK